MLLSFSFHLQYTHFFHKNLAIRKKGLRWQNIKKLQDWTPGNLRNFSNRRQKIRKFSRYLVWESPNTRFFLYKHHRYKHREPLIWPKIKHHLSTSLSLTSLQHTNLVCASYLNFPNFNVFVNTKIHRSYSFRTLNHSSFKIFKFLWLGCTTDEHKSY